MTKTNFARIPPILPLPELLEMQKKSFRDFLQEDVLAEKRKIQGLMAPLLDVFPITNADDTMELQFLGYELGEPQYTIDEAISDAYPGKWRGLPGLEADWKQSQK